MAEIGTVPSIVFDPTAHRYTVDGAHRLSVTQHLERAGISDWSGVPPETLAIAQERGTMVHKAAHLINQNDLDPDSVDERIAGYIKAYVRAKTEMDLQVRLSEHLVYRRLTIRDTDVVMPAATDLHIVGMLDIEGYAPKLGNLVVDLKTGEKSASWPPQLAAYTRALSSKSHITHKRLVIQLRKDGTYKLHWFPQRDFDRDWGVFRSAMIDQKREELGQ